MKQPLFGAMYATIRLASGGCRKYLLWLANIC